MPVPRIAARAQIRENVRAAEAVDRLLRVADKEHRKAAAPIYALEDAVLNRIGVLELVDERRLVALAYGACESLAVFAVHCTLQIEQQVVVGLEPQGPLARSKFAVTVFEKFRR